jgi:sugar lactone lactonase YvrE
VAEATLVWDERALLGEGPIWDDRVERLLWVDVDGRTLHTLDPRSGERRSERVDARISSVALRERGGYVVAHDRGFSLLEHGAVVPLATDVCPNGPRMNDGACDEAGRYWAGSVAPDDRPGTGALYRLDPDGVIEAVVIDVGCSNGIDWSLDGSTMYYVDSLAHGVDAFDFDVSTGRIANRRRVAEIPDALPDGLTVDGEGAIWVALWGGWCVRRYSPGGEVLDTLELPVSQVSSCIFGDADLGTLYVTSARTGLDDSQLEHEPHAGSLFSFRPGVRGRTAFRFAG